MCVVLTASPILLMIVEVKRLLLIIFSPNLAFF